MRLDPRDTVPASARHAKARARAERRALEPSIAAVLRPLVYFGGALTFAVPLAPWEVAWSLAACAFLGGLLGRPLARSPLRSWAIALLALSGVLLSVALRDVLLTHGVPAPQLGPALSLRVGDAIGFGLAALVLATAVRALALRIWLLRVVEVAFVATAFAELVAAHRGGAINRPFELADSIIAAGGDPTVALLAVGAAAAAVSVLLLLGEQSLWRSLLHLGVVALLLGLVLSSTQLLGMPQPKAGSGSLGLRPEDGKGTKDNGQRDPHGERGGGQPPKNDELEFNDNYDSQGRHVPVAVVLLHDDYSPPQDLYYFRQAAFSQFNGRRLVAATLAGVDEDLVPGFVAEKTELLEVPNGHRDRVELETTVAMLSEHNRPFALEAPIEVEPESNPDPGRFRRVYRVRSAALAISHDGLLGRGVGNPEWSDEQRAHYTAVPEDPRYRELAEQVVAELPPELASDPVAKGLLASIWLGREGTYSLKSAHASAKDPTADFLFGDRVGYCVHFAHAAAFLMRSLGIPARVASGYAIEEAARQGGSAILLTGAHSHAWPEMYVTGVGWVVADVFPERSLDPPVQPPDADLQRLLGEMARGSKPLPQGEDRPLEPFIAAFRALPGLIARTLSLLIPLLLVLGYTVKLWRRVAPAWSATSAPRTAYRASLDRLSELSITRSYGETREGFAARLAELPSFRALTGEHVRASFGAGAKSSATELRSLSERVAQELAQSTPWFRRLRGVLHPFSWLRSR